jgi:hypothetical protein
MLAFLLALALGQTPLVPAEFKVPDSYTGKGYVLEPLGPKHAQLDYEAYMGSMDHIRANFGSGKWPTPGITMAEAVKDVEGEQERFQARKSFTYAVLSPDRKKELGCVYLRRSNDPDHDVAVAMWTIKPAFDQGLQKQLEADLRVWLTSKWPFRKPLFRNVAPGRQ